MQRPINKLLGAHGIPVHAHLLAFDNPGARLVGHLSFHVHPASQDQAVTVAPGTNPRQGQILIQSCTLHLSPAFRALANPTAAGHPDRDYP